MREIAKTNAPFECTTIAKQEAIKLFEQKGEKYKELAQAVESDTVSFYKSGNFTDLCKGPHVKSTGEIKHFKLLSVAGAYWRGDSTREQLQRIYGTVFLQNRN